jgi:integrase
MKAPAKEVSRDRVLTDSEIIVAWNVWENMAWPFGDAFKLMLITGQRRSEVASMRWKDIDKKRRVWTLPREHTKSDRLNEVPLSTLAFEIIDAVPKSGPLLFSTNNKTPISGFSKAKSYCDAEILKILKKENPKAKLVAWRLHDLRRTLSTNMARLRISENVVERLINHAIGASKGTAGIYNRHGYTDEKQHAMEVWASFLIKLMSHSDDKVVSLPLSAKSL